VLSRGNRQPKRGTLGAPMRVMALLRRD
jgi:hypothetical protein